MSVQLILYTQSQTTTNQFVVNGHSFDRTPPLNSTTSYGTTAGLPDQDAIDNSPPIITNKWYRYYTNAGGGWGVVATPSEGGAPVGVLGEAVIHYAVAAARSGMYQKLSGLIVGASYTITVDIAAAVVGTINLKTYSGSLLQTTYSTSSNTTQVSTSFVATSSNDTFLIEYQSTVSYLRITDISITGQIVSAIGFYEGQVICDLYENEDMPLTLSVDNFKNVAEKVQSYSKSFNLPATKRNNQIFTNLFEVTMVQDVYSFNPYIKTKSVLKENGVVLFQGYLRLIDIQDKEAEISYNVNLYSEVIALADVLENKSFQDIDLTELQHPYNKQQIKYSWNDGVTVGQTTPITWDNTGTSGFRTDFNTLKYPFVDWTHQQLISNGATGNSSISGYPELVRLEQAFRPFINIKYLIDRIFGDTDFTYTSTLFDSTDFGNLFMDFNWGGNELPGPDTTYNARWSVSCGAAFNVGNSAWKDLRLIPESVAGGCVDSEVPPNYQNSGVNIYKIVETTDHQWYEIIYGFRFTGGVGDPIQARWVKNEGTATETVRELQPNLVAGATSTWYTGNFTVRLDAGDTLSAQFNAAATVQQAYGVWFSYCQFILSSSLVDNAVLQTLRGELGQWDFLKGILTMFNLISMPDKDNPKNIKFETYNDVFITASDIITHDWTDKIDVSEMKLTPLTELNKMTIFKFAEDDDDYIFNVYKQSVGGHLYGSKVFDASGLTLLTGKDEIVAEPFAATISKPLDPQFFDFIVPSLYAMNDDGTTEGFDNAPRIMYNNGIKDTMISYYIPEQNGLSSENQDEFLQFSHLTEIPTTTTAVDFHFGECQLIPPIGEAVSANLFNLYWLPYYNELYNSNTRTMSLKVNLSPSDISLFKFNDKIFIKNRTYRVNKIDYKPNDLATVEFILIP